MIHIFTKRSRIDASAEQVFAWHTLPNILEKLTPPWEKSEIIEPAPNILDGARGVLQVRIGPIPVRWEFEHTGYKEGREFQDFQRAGPFRRWAHTHRFIPDGPQTCWLEDRVEYELPFGAVGDFFARRFIRRKLERIFAYRHRITQGSFSPQSQE